MTRIEDVTLREKEILLYRAEGLTEPQIATKLGIATPTVKAHTYNVRLKLQATNAAHAIAIALREGIIE